MNFLNWLLTSSADPEQYSLTVKGALGLGVSSAGATDSVRVSPHLHLGRRLCASSAIDSIANIVYMGLSLFGSLAFLWGLARKMWNGRWSAA